MWYWKETKIFKNSYAPSQYIWVRCFPSLSILGHVPQEAHWDQSLCARILLERVLGNNTCEGERKERIAEGEVELPFKCNRGLSQNPMGSSEVGMILQSYPRFKQNAQCKDTKWLLYLCIHQSRHVGCSGEGADSWKGSHLWSISHQHSPELENECLGPKGVLGGPSIHYTLLLYHHYLTSHSKFNLSGKAPLGFWLFPFPGESQERKVNRMNYNLDAAASLRPATDICHLPSLLFILISLHQQYLHWTTWLK